MISDYLSIVHDRLNSRGFGLKEGVVYRNQRYISVARRIRFQPEFFGFAITFFMFAGFSTIDNTLMREYSAKCFKLANRSKIIPLPRGILNGVICLPVALAGTVDEETSSAIRTQEPPMHWSAFEMPVIVELGSNSLHYLQSTPHWGRIYWDTLRAMIEEILAP